MFGGKRLQLILSILSNEPGATPIRLFYLKCSIGHLCINDDLWVDLKYVNDNEWVDDDAGDDDGGVDDGGDDVDDGQIT